MIRLDNISIGYSSKSLLDNFSYIFEDNKIYGILGKSGSGKTTLLRTIAGLDKPIKGCILKDNKKLEKAGKNGIYMMHQNYTAFDWLNVLDNILIAYKIKHRIREQDVDRAKDILEKVGLLEHINKFPTEISGGQRQRLALARTIFTEPSVILMDEPLSALDEKTRENMQDLILDYHKKNKGTIIMVTHSKDEADKMCNDILELDSIC